MELIRILAFVLGFLISAIHCLQQLINRKYENFSRLRLVLSLDFILATLLFGLNHPFLSLGISWLSGLLAEVVEVKIAYHK
jgi:hypothetical protein